MSRQPSPAGYRPATLADLEAEHAVFCRAEGGVLQARGYAWVDRPFESFAPIQRHLLAHDPDRCFVAEVEGRVVGFTAAFVRESVWFFAALFIDPAFQGRGIGRRLFELASDDLPPRRMTITDSIQPISTALYARHGLIPTTPILGFEGRPVIDRSTDLEPGAPTPETLAMLDGAAYGFDRSIDHRYWASEASATVWMRGPEPVAYAYSWPDGSIGPLAGRDEASAADALRAELARHRSGVWVEMPGTARTLVETALGAGLRISPPPGLLLLSEGVEPPRALAISSYWLL